MPRASEVAVFARDAAAAVGHRHLEHFSDLLYDELPYRFVSRTSISNRIEEYMIGAGMEYHMEHHLFPKMPYHQLKRFHTDLADKGFFEEMDSERPNILSGGYTHFWRSIFADTLVRQSTSPIST